MRVLTVSAVLVLALGGTTVPAFAASPSAASLVTTPRFVRPNVDVPIFGIDLIVDGFCTTFTQVVVDFRQVTGGGTFDPDDLEANGEDSGLELWRDSGPTADQFDSGDVKVPSSYATTPIENGFRATITISPAHPLPAAEEGLYTFFLTMRLSSDVANGDDVRVTLPEDAFQTDGGVLCLSDPSITSMTTATMTADETPPAVILFTKPVAQSDNLSWKINEPVVINGNIQDTVILREEGAATEWPVTVSYNAATQTIVADPVSYLRAGQHYRAFLLPDGPGAITDQAGNPMAPRSDLFRAATNVNELAYGVRYFWRGLANSSTYGGSYLVNNTKGATVAYKFSGTSIVWYTITDPYQGKASVSIDGKSFGIINNYSSSARYKVGRTFSGLSSGAHTITIRVYGALGSTSGRDMRVAVDAFRWGGSTDVTPYMSHRWAAISTSGADGGSYRVARFSGTEMQFVFSGTSISWRTIRGPAMGQAYVYIDGALKGVFDNYSSSTQYKYMRAFLNLSPGTHTIRIKVASTRNSRSTDRNIAIDGFVIG